jgi:hypothetical protein
VVVGTDINSYLTLLGGVSSGNYLTDINNGAAGAVLDLVLPSGAPAWASSCLDVLREPTKPCVLRRITRRAQTIRWSSETRPRAPPTRRPIGAAATSSVANSVALGHQSAATRGAPSNLTAYGLTALQKSAGGVSIGSPGKERQITNVPAGTHGTDTVSLNQLDASVTASPQQTVRYDTNSDGSIACNSVTLGNRGSSTAIHDNP